MAVIQRVILFMSAYLVLLTSGQRPSFAGSRPIGYPVLENRTTTPSGLEDKFGEGTTQRLPIEAQGDRELVDRLSKLPLDKQPFWFINWQAYEANRNKPQTYPQRPNPFLESVPPNPINTNPGINVNTGSVNINSPQPVATVNNGNVNTAVKPQIPHSNTGQNALNIKSGDTDLGNRYATESTTFVTTIGTSDAKTNKPVSDTSNDNVNNEDDAKKPKPSAVEPSNDNESFTPIFYYKDIVTFDTDYEEDVVTGKPNIDSTNKEPVLTLAQHDKETDNKNINTPAVPDETDKNKSSKNDDGASEKSKTDIDGIVKSRNDEKLPVITKTDTKIDSDAKKPEIKDKHELTDRNIYIPKHPRRKSFESATEDYYEDIEVKKVIKLYPGIISFYQR